MAVVVGTVIVAPLPTGLKRNILSNLEDMDKLTISQEFALTLPVPAPLPPRPPPRT